MAELVYFLCTVTSLLGAILLYDSYRRKKVRILFWTSLCFFGFALNNIMLMIDLLIFPSIDLGIPRLLPAAAGLLATIYGFIRDSR